MRRQEVLAAEAEEEADIAHAEVEAAQYSSDGDEFESAFGHSGFDETLHDSRSSDSGASASESKSAASLTPPASPRKFKLFFLLVRQWVVAQRALIDCLAHQPFLAIVLRVVPCLAAAAAPGPASVASASDSLASDDFLTAGSASDSEPERVDPEPQIPSFGRPKIPRAAEVAASWCRQKRKLADDITFQPFCKRAGRCSLKKTIEDNGNE